MFKISIEAFGQKCSDPKEIVREGTLIREMLVSEFSNISIKTPTCEINCNLNVTEFVYYIIKLTSNLISGDEPSVSAQLIVSGDTIKLKKRNGNVFVSLFDMYERKNKEAVVGIYEFVRELAALKADFDLHIRERTENIENNFDYICFNVGIYR